MKTSIQLLAGLTFAVLVSSLVFVSNSQAEERYYEPLRLNQYYPNDNLHQPMASTVFVTFGGSYHSHFGHGSSFGGGHGYSNAASLWSGYCGQKRHCGVKQHFGHKRFATGGCGCAAPAHESSYGCDSCQGGGHGRHHGFKFRLGQSHFFGRHHRGSHGGAGCSSCDSCGGGAAYGDSYDESYESAPAVAPAIDAPATDAPAVLPPHPESTTRSLPLNGAASINASAI